MSSHRGLDLSDERKVSHMYLLSDVGCYSDAQNAKYDIVGEIPRHPDLGSADARKVEHNVRDGGFSQMKLHRMQVKIGKHVDQVILMNTSTLETRIYAPLRGIQTHPQWML